ncbi:MAG: SRPBCC family protein [Ilumatobacteraceae bacterium]|nr:SRPBCC family protein [Ilumatobacteraceae bacterium]
MRVSSVIVIDAPLLSVLPFVSVLDAYPLWMNMVHRAEVSKDCIDEWNVELRARVGPLARSKRLLMKRTTSEVAANGDTAKVVFERAESDGRQHAQWVLTIDLTTAEPSASTRVDVELFYGGALWTGGILERVLADNIRSGHDRLCQVVKAKIS